MTDFSPKRRDSSSTVTNNTASKSQQDLHNEATTYPLPLLLTDDVEAHQESAGEVTRVATNDRPYTTFTGRQKAILVLISTLGACFSHFTANIYFPAIDTISRALRVSVSEVNLTITTYLIFQGIAPSFISAIADEYGRRPAYVVGFTIYMLANLGLGLNNSYAGLLVLRCIQSCGCSGLVSLNQGTVADIITSAERGKYISITSIATILAPSVAPIAGGLLADHLGWHSIFWFLLILSGIYFIPLLLFFPETARKIVGDGSIDPPKWNRCLTDLLRERKAQKDMEKIEPTNQQPPSNPDSNNHPHKTRFNPLATLSILADPETALLLTTSGILYATFYALSTSLTVQFHFIYNLSTTQQGLLFLPQALGTIFAAIFNTHAIDARYRVHAARSGIPVDRHKQIDILSTSMPIERARLEIAVPMMTICYIATIIYGWLLHARVHIAGPITMLFIIGFTALSSFSVLSVLIIDLHRSRAATAGAANILVRCLLGAGSSAVVGPVIGGIGLGWCFTLVGGIGLVSLPLLGVCVVRGVGMRGRRREREGARAKLREEKVRRTEQARGENECKKG
ncbi:hypothetical protein PMZ80_010340 [Knufia obscura]|uniref:Major facilitator superfamily (MFS) profile domain-containing protein n=1 Tax=Knufia obscura TaxID=1635080 RepID=A0ABR0R9N5_9EURO|nr:hypothetical protein PMZ80_010340 [Knufia obscura]